MKKIYLQVPEPCHEDWNKMSAAESGRFCGSCSKEVIDFSVMSDQEIISYLSKPRGGTCGRFSADQLSRPITEPAMPSRKWSWGLMFSFLVTFIGACKQKSNETIGKLAPAQSSKKDCKAPVKHIPEANKVEVIETGVMIVGELMAPPIEYHEPRPEPAQAILDISVVLHGQVTDSSLHPIPYASLHVIDNKEMVTADSNGRYELELSVQTDIAISVSSIGYETQQIHIPINAGKIERDIILREKVRALEDIVVVSTSGSDRTSVSYGGLSIVSCGIKTTPEKIFDTIQNLFQPSAIKLFPNPAVKGSRVNIELNTPSDYQVKLTDNQSRIILQTAFGITAKHQAYQLDIPSALASGIYYVIITDKKSRKQYTEKLIIQ